MAGTSAGWVGPVVLERRQALGVSQQGLATRTGGSVTYLALPEAGRLPKLNSEPLSHVAEALGYTRNRAAYLGQAIRSPDTGANCVCHLLGNASLAALLYDAMRRGQGAAEVELVPSVGAQPTAEAVARWLKDVRSS